MQQGAGHAHALALAARKIGAALVNHHVEPAVGLHKGRHARAVERAQKLGIGGVGLGEQQVVAQGAGEQIAVGGHQGHSAHKRGSRGVAQLNAADANVAPVGILAACDDPRERGLAATAFAHERHERTARDGRVGAVQHGTVAVGIAHAGKFDIAAAVKLNIAALGLGRIQNAEHAARGGHAVHGRVKQRP